jgi:homoserine O-succinyltransferase
MPIIVPDTLPALVQLEQDGIGLISSNRAVHQDIRPLEIAILNLMPLKQQTELQFLRLLGNSPLQVNVTLLMTGSYTSKHTEKSHLEQFYQTYADVKDRNFDGLLITGAPIGHLAYEQIEYWPELSQIFEWSLSHVTSTFNLCWAAMAALHYHHGVPKHQLAQKKFGVFMHETHQFECGLLRGFDDDFMVPVSRHTEVRAEDLPKNAGLEILASSPDAGLCLVRDVPKRQVYMINHLEYDRWALDREYRRDIAADKPINIPQNYYLNNDPTQRPRHTWRSLGYLLFNNWLSELYRDTPFDLATLPEFLQKNAPTSSARG